MIAPVCVLSWLLETAPVYWSKSVEIVRPYASLVRVHVLNMLDILYRTARPLLDFCHLYLTQLFAAVSYVVLLLPYFTTRVSCVCLVVIKCMFSSLSVGIISTGETLFLSCPSEFGGTQLPNIFYVLLSLQCYDTVGWASGIASGM